MRQVSPLRRDSIARRIVLTQPPDHCPAAQSSNRSRMVDKLKAQGQTKSRIQDILMAAHIWGIELY
jgi:hypothetical protein